MILPIYTYGQPVLRKEAQDITPDYPELKTLIANMYETLTESDGIGLAAPHAFINPYILEYDEDSKKETMEEGCLSLPGIHESVTRPTRIHVKYMDEDFNEHDEWVEGYLARVMQHEFDHLGGKMFIDRISPMRRQLIRGKLKNLLLGRFRCSYRTKVLKK